MHQLFRIGIGGMTNPNATRYAAVLAALEGATLAGIWDADAKRAAMFAEQYGGMPHPSLDDLLAQVDALIVTAAPAERPAIVGQAARAGVALLCEPALGATLAEAQSVADACAKIGARLAIAFPLRYHHALQQLRQALQGGALGELLLIRIAGQGVYSAMDHHEVLMARATPLADLLYWLTGRAPRRVYAEMARLRDGLIEDTALLQIALDGDVSANLDPSWSRPPGYPSDGDLTIEISGTAGVAHVDAFSQHIEYFGDRPHAGRRGWGDDLHRLVLADWLDSLRAGRPAPIAAADGLRALELVSAAQRSAELGVVVEL